MPQCNVKTQTHMFDGRNFQAPTSFSLWVWRLVAAIFDHIYFLLPQAIQSVHNI